jgi:hypothetical protein
MKNQTVDRSIVGCGGGKGGEEWEVRERQWAGNELDVRRDLNSLPTKAGRVWESVCGDGGCLGAGGGVEGVRRRVGGKFAREEKSEKATAGEKMCKSLK